MRVIELARKLKLGEMYIHLLMRELSAKKGITFTKKGKAYDLTAKEVKVLVKEIERRKGTEYDLEEILA